MSRREARDSHGKRWESRSERDPSPKRSRRDGKHETEQSHPENSLKTMEQADGDQKYPSRSKDDVPVEANLPSESKGKSDFVNKEVKKSDIPSEGTRNSNDETDVPRSRLHFQHGDRGGEEHGDGRGIGRRATERRPPWDDPKESSSPRFRDDRASELQRRDRNPNRLDDRFWRHDRYQELEAGAAPPARRRPAFRESKAPAAEPLPTARDAAGAEFLKSSRRDRPGYRGREMPERSGFAGADDRIWREDRPLQWGENRRPSYHPRERFGPGAGAGGRWGRERWIDGRYGESSGQPPQFGGGYQAERWKHDLFDEGNRSPTPKNEEDEIAKVEALLSS
ncbi:unnamed protein product [Spirodela intermedia]|uniref:Uncharacterized protein n=1 Tax=Spirodela intermedia TaxID=51605 RepID=A0A7I8L4P1_SPIIN|nr:unnamed protein product [Spirodela intermedia]